MKTATTPIWRGEELHASPMEWSQFFHQQIFLTDIALPMAGFDVVFCMSSPTRKWYHMIKLQRMFWQDWSITNMACHALSIKNAFVVHFFDRDCHLSCFAAHRPLAVLLRIVSMPFLIRCSHHFNILGICCVLSAFVFILLLTPFGRMLVTFNPIIATLQAIYFVPEFLTGVFCELLKIFLGMARSANLQEWKRWLHIFCLQKCPIAGIISGTGSAISASWGKIVKRLFPLTSGTVPCILGYNGHAVSLLYLSSRPRMLAHREGNTLLPQHFTIKPPVEQLQGVRS